MIDKINFNIIYTKALANKLWLMGLITFKEKRKIEKLAEEQNKCS
ncbi:MAG: hypothetical protein R3Y65_03405 [Bacillota bacterium]